MRMLHKTAIFKRADDCSDRTEVKEAIFLLVVSAELISARWCRLQIRELHAEVTRMPPGTERVTQPCRQQWNQETKRNQETGLKTRDS